MNYIIEKYINNITINNINDFALKNNIILTKKEEKIIYDIIKNHYKDILSGNDKPYIELLKKEFNENTFTKVITLYNKYKTIYNNF